MGSVLNCVPWVSISVLCHRAVPLLDIYPNKQLVKTHLKTCMDILFEHCSWSGALETHKTTDSEGCEQERGTCSVLYICDRYSEQNWTEACPTMEKV